MIDDGVVVVAVGFSLLDVDAVHGSETGFEEFEWVGVIVALELVSERISITVNSDIVFSERKVGVEVGENAESSVEGDRVIGLFDVDIDVELIVIIGKIIGDVEAVVEGAVREVFGDGETGFELFVDVSISFTNSSIKDGDIFIDFFLAGVDRDELADDVGIITTDVKELFLIILAIEKSGKGVVARSKIDSSLVDVFVAMVEINCSFSGLVVNDDFDFAGVTDVCDNGNSDWYCDKYSGKG